MKYLYENSKNNLRKIKFWIEYVFSNTSVINELYSFIKLYLPVLQFFSEFHASIHLFAREKHKWKLTYNNKCIYI